MADTIKFVITDKADRLTFYEECKNVIFNLMQQNQKLSSQIQRKDQIIQQLLTEKQQFQIRLQNPKENHSHMQKIKKLQAHAKQFQKLVHQKDQSIQNLKQQLYALRSKINQLDQSVSRYNSIITKMQSNVHRLKQALSLVQEQNNILAATLHEKQISSNYQIQELKKVINLQKQSNQRLKRRMQLFTQVHQQSLLSTIPYQNQLKTLYTDQHQSVKEIESQLLIRPSNHSSKFNTIKQKQLSYSPQQQNPEMKHHLKESAQDTLSKTRFINSEYHRKKKQKALQRLENRIGKMLSKIECSDNQSNKDQL